MAGFGAFLGGALQGVGQGLATVGQQQWQERRDAALSKLRQDEMRVQGQINDQNNASSTARKLDADVTLQANDQEFRTRTAREGAAVQASEAEKNRQHQINMERLKQAFDANQAEKSRAFQREQDWGKPIDSFVDEETGDVTMIYRGGKTEKYQGVARKRPRGSDSSSLFADSPSGGTSPASAPASSGRTATRAQLEELARQSGQSIEDAEAWAKANGFTIR